jgi:hypothetical protein
LLSEGSTSVPLGSGGVDLVYRVDLDAATHGAFALRFPASTPSVTLSVWRWDGARPLALGTTDEGAGVRFLAALDPGKRRTYWVVLHAGAPASATLDITRTPFAEGLHCASDCAHLLQLPVANDPFVDGYDADLGTVYRYQFGRRDLVMLIRHVARTRAQAGMGPLFPHDLSQWDGQTPGTDEGAPRHASHERGKDADISLYGLDGLAPWRSYCTTHDIDGGRECLSGTLQNFDGYADALEIAAALASGRVTLCFLDQELIAAVVAGAREAAADQAVDGSLALLLADGEHLQHWPNHDNHVHIRVSEVEYDVQNLFDLRDFQAP